MPRPPPVTRTLCIRSKDLTGGRDVELFDKLDHGRHLVGREARPAIGNDTALDVVASAGIAAVGKNNVGDHDGAGDRTFACLDARHPHRVIAVDYGFDFFGVNFQTADIDDAATAADKVIAVAAQFDHVAGVDETF